MFKAILGKKIKMSQVFDEKGNVIPVTVVQAGPCYVTAIRTKEKDGYQAIQIGFGGTKKLTKPEEKHLEKAGIKEKLKHLREFEVGDEKVIKSLKTGDRIDISIFKEGDKITVSGISKGKGFAGVIKRWGFARGPETHGSDHHRRPGSIGSMFPQRVIKGKKMPGRMGGKRVTTKGLEIIRVIPETNILMIKGAVPGPRKGLIEIRG
jgi:large subunit ribosomal protein L3